VCNDLRLLSSGSRCGFGEINLPLRQAGSSIRAGKANPVVPEVINQIAFEVIRNDLTVTFASDAGQLQLNAFDPIIAFSLFKRVIHLRKGCKALADDCIDDITANRDMLRASVERSSGVVTALNPYIGYANATKIAAEAYLSGRGVAEIVLERKLISPEQLAAVLRPEVLTQPQIPAQVA
jgi:aspartate ammonia-lyase